MTRSRVAEALAPGAACRLVSGIRVPAARRSSHFRS